MENMMITQPVAVHRTLIILLFKSRMSYSSRILEKQHYCGAIHGHNFKLEKLLSICNLHVYTSKKGNEP